MLLFIACLVAAIIGFTNGLRDKGKYFKVLVVLAIPIILVEPFIPYDVLPRTFLTSVVVNGLEIGFYGMGFLCARIERMYACEAIRL